MCIAWLLGRCYHDKKCYYAHDRAYLPHSGWWSSQETVRALGEELEVSLLGSANKRYDTDLFFMTLWVQNRWQADEWMSGRFSALDDEAAPTGRPGDSVILNTTQRDGKFQYEYTVQSGSAARAQANRGGDEVDDDDYGGDSADGDYGADYLNDEDDDGGSWNADRETEERSKNFGFSDDEVSELLCQGVKPWDDDAWVCAPNSVLTTVPCTDLGSSGLLQDVLRALQGM